MLTIMDKNAHNNGHRGRRVGGEPGDESEHFMRCGSCGQAFDMRSLVQVAHHEVPGHNPLALDS